MQKNELICLVFTLVISPAFSLDDQDIKYMLYTGVHSDSPYETSLGFSQKYSDEGTMIKGAQQVVKILCHGYLHNSTDVWIQPTKTAYISQGINYVIAVDWGKHAYGDYETVRRKTPDVGDHIARLVMELSTNFEIPLANIHLIGHSLGSHISGFAGKRVQEMSGMKLGRITGLDPAGPGFNFVPEDHRLTPNDANFVDAIHTDINSLGYKNEIAHADFWPNGGLFQMGCYLIDIACSHYRAPTYFHEGIGNRNFPARKCDSYQTFEQGGCSDNEVAIMGDSCDSSANGNYYLNTNNVSPYGIP